MANRLTKWPVVILALLSLTACTSGPGYEELRQEPAYQLLQPGSFEIGLETRGGDPSWAPTGQNNGWTEKIVGSSSTMDEIVALYQVELAKDGWEAADPSGRVGVCSHWPDTSWQKGDLNIALGFFDELPEASQEADKRCLRFLPDGAFDQYATLYEVTLTYNRD